MAGYLRRLSPYRRVGGYISGGTASQPGSYPTTTSAVWSLDDLYLRRVGPLLDNYPNAAAAYSLRPLTSAYTGPVVTVRRSSDSAEADFTAAEVSDGTLEAWCGAGDGLVKTLYDQSGHGRHASQSTATAQPKIVSGGVLVLENGLPAIEFDGTDDSIAASITGLSGFQNMTAACVFSTDTAAAADTGGLMLWSFGKGGTSPRSLFIAQTTGGLSGEYITLGFEDATSRRLGSTSYRRNADESSLLFSTHTQSGTSMFSDGSEINLNLSFLMTTSTAAAPYNTGYTSDDLLTFSALRQTGYPTYFSQSKIQELIIYPVDQSANRVAIEDNINDHYNVFDPTVLLLHMDGTNGSTTFTDSSLNNFTVTANGDAQISTTQSKFGGSSAYIDASGDYLSLPSSDALLLAANNFTIEFWLYKNAFSTNAHDTVLYLNGNTTAQGAVRLANVNASGTLRLYTVDSDLTQQSDDASTSLTYSQWQHYAIVRNGANVSLYLDGSAVASITLPAADKSLTTGTTNWIGNLRFTSGNWFLNGYIDDLRITKGRALYTANFTPPTQAHPDPVPADPYFNQVSLLLPMDGADGSNTFVDKSKNAFAVTPYGDASISTTQSKFGGASGAFDGTGDWVTTAVSNELALETGAFTVECWIYWDGTITGTPFMGVLGVHNSGSTGRYSIFMNSSGIGHYIQTAFPAMSAFSANQWTHIASTRDDAGVCRFFIDGVLKTTVTDSGNLTAPQGFRVGNDFNSGRPPFSGYIDDLRVTKGIARYTSNFTPPTSPHPHL